MVRACRSVRSVGVGDGGGAAEGYGVEVAEDLEGEFVGEGGNEVDLELFLDLTSDGGQLGEATLG